KSSRDVSRRSHSDFSMPRICEQSGLLPVVPTPRDAGGTVSACVATRVRFLLLTSEAALGVFGRTVCCDVALGAGVISVDEAGVSTLDEAGVAFDDSEAGVGWDGVGEVVARGFGVAGGCDVVGWRTGVCAPAGLGCAAFEAGAAG
ncbi:MAG TPA: hypothetical protein VFO35_07390, partial [Steroidobacteraceae bacterium]|nr:hypothetical protein [Steroidobacteraceae bacterium]